jgi:hypothetical protein
VSGWVVYADRVGHDDEQPVDAGKASALTITPAGSNLSCASVAIRDWTKGDVQPWTVDLAYTAVVGSDGKVSWTEISGLGDQGTLVTTNQTGKVRSSTVMNALGALGAPAPSGFGAETPDLPTTLAPGRYVAYSGTQLVPVTFAGTCGPSGDAISGTWTAYNDRTKGLLDCGAFISHGGLPPDLKSKAAALCPKG